MRKTKAKARPVMPDPRYQDITVSRFVNNLMKSGKKSLAYSVFYEAMDIIDAKGGDEDGLATFKRALDNVTPQVEVRSRRVGGATFQIPQEIRHARKVSMGMKWLVFFARKRNGKSFGAKLADELMAAAREEGAAYKRKEDTHRMAEANKAFSHFRF